MTISTPFGNVVLYESNTTAMSGNLTKRDIVLKIYDKTNFPQKEVRETVQLTLDAIAEALAEGRNVELRNFGVFEVQLRKSRIGRNPNRPEKDVVIPKRAVIKFKAGKELKAHLKDLNLDDLEHHVANGTGATDPDDD